MRLVRTIKLRLQEDPQVFQPTVDAYTKAFNLTCQTGWNDKDFNGVSLHNKVYKQTREYLPSQLAVSARMKATEALKSVRKKLKKSKNVSCPQSKQTSIRYDARSYNVWFDRGEISLSTIDGRKTVKVVIPEYFKQYLDWRRCSADLFLRNGMVFLNIVFEKEVPDLVSNGKFLGIDRGIKKIAVTSDKRFFSKCGHVARGNRTKQSIFKCRKCGYQCNADLNASFNIVLNFQNAISHSGRARQEALCSQPSRVA